MKNQRTFWIWAALAVCAVTLVAAMVWQTRSAMVAAEERAAADARADLQERMRLALWRMDTLGAVIRSSFTDDTVSHWMKARFSWNEPTGLSASSDVPLRIDPESRREILDRLTAPQREIAVLDNSGNWRKTAEGQQIADHNEWANRGRAIQQISITPLSNLSSHNPGRALWISGELYLIQSLSTSGFDFSGAWIDKVRLRQDLLGEIRDLLPAADLVPATELSADSLVLASFPFRLDPGPIAALSPDFAPGAKASLVGGWVAAVLAIATAFLLVAGIMRLSERRASFVSAVTHELRTPLTTFRLYSEMLETGVVKPEKRGDYLKVLTREADRLSHLVENVLAFSRIEKGSARSALTSIAPGELVGRLRERLEAHLASADLRLVIDVSDEAAVRNVRVDVAAIDHILFNLIDNVVKYAAASDPAEVEISFAAMPKWVEVLVSDHGPGIPEEEFRRVFRAFHKSARHAAETRPGVGLGLALSRRLARSFGGDLRIAPPHEKRGACFVLSLPVD